MHACRSNTIDPPATMGGWTRGLRSTGQFAANIHDHHRLFSPISRNLLKSRDHPSASPAALKTDSRSYWHVIRQPAPSPALIMPKNYAIAAETSSNSTPPTPQKIDVLPAPVTKQQPGPSPGYALTKPNNCHELLTLEWLVRNRP